MDNRVTVTITMSASEYTAIAEVMDGALARTSLSDRQINALDAFLQVREKFGLLPPDIASMRNRAV